MSVSDLPDLQYYGYVDDFYASLEWSAGGLIHTHIALWIVGSPRIDKVEVPIESKDDVVEIDVTPADAFVLATFWDRVFNEFNVSKLVQEAWDPVFLGVARKQRQEDRNHSQSVLVDERTDGVSATESTYWEQPAKKLRRLDSEPL